MTPITPMAPMLPSGRVLALLTAAALLVGCAPATSETTSPSILDEAGIIAEYHAEAQQLRLAPGDSWQQRPAELVLTTPDPARPMMYEAGVGIQTAHFHWYCSWARIVLEQPAERPAALDQLKEFPGLSVWEAMDHVGHDMFDRILQDASRGDRGELAAYVAENC